MGISAAPVIIRWEFVSNERLLCAQNAVYSGGRGQDAPPDMADGQMGSKDAAMDVVDHAHAPERGKSAL